MIRNTGVILVNKPVVHPFSPKLIQLLKVLFIKPTPLRFLCLSFSIRPSCKPRTLTFVCLTLCFRPLLRELASIRPRTVDSCGGGTHGGMGGPPAVRVKLIHLLVDGENC